ncbi:synaptogenesis protein syg-2-like [Strongylocentrotus purpuratus]|uniref:Ig-like domain-containing protein n=1 Tax=Strongylocentrotus purpuratus TaxID=7668 RepID=A0A7M7NFW6_STRPU|nr:synaptogenesis protein syg-2-like [Strongylocentrotus purpuratus]
MAICAKVLVFLAAIISKSAPPYRIIITDGILRGYTPNNASVTVKARQQHDITCEAYGARPPAVLEWHIPDGVTVVLQKQSDVVQDNSYVSLKAVTITPSRNDQGKSLYCVVSHPVLQNNLQHSVHLNVQGPPDNVKMTTPDDLRDGIETNVTCTAVNGYPAPLIHWYIGSTNVTQDSSFKTSVNEIGRYDAESTLTLIPKRIDHGKPLICQAVQPTTPSIWSVNDSIVLNISFEPRLLSITDGLTQNRYKYGSSVSITSGQIHNLTCSVQGARPPAELEWHIPEEVQIRLEDQYNGVSGDAYTSQTVVSVTPSRNDDGKIFRCVASHRELDNELQLFIQLDVQVPPSDLELTAYGSIASNATETRSVIIFEDSATSFTCKSVGSRPKALISWTIGSEDDLGSTTSTSTTNEADQGLRDTKSTLEMIPRRRHHNKLLRCVACAGINQSHTEVRVIVFAPPNRILITDERSGGYYTNNADMTVTAGELYTITCVAFGARPPAILEWRIPDDVTVVLQNQSDVAQSNSFISRKAITITPSTNARGKNLRCVASHPELPSSRQSSVYLKVQGSSTYNTIRAGSSTYNTLNATSMSTRIWNPEVIPVFGENITLVCIYTPPSTSRLLSWRNVDGILLAIDTCQGVGYSNKQNVPDVSKYSLRVDSSSAEPTLLSITDGRTENGYKYEESVSITYGRTHNLTCSVEGARPPAELEWHVPEEVEVQMEDQYNVVHVDAYTSRRVVSVTPSRDDDGKIFRCMASHRELDNKLRSTIRLHVQVSPRNLRLTTSDPMTIDEAGTRSVIVFEDSATSFTCKSTGSRPKAVVSWIIGSDDDLGSTASMSTLNQTDQGLRDTKSTLQFNPKEEASQSTSPMCGLGWYKPESNRSEGYRIW